MVFMYIMHLHVLVWTFLPCDLSIKIFFVKTLCYVSWARKNGNIFVFVDLVC